ncbi:MAG: hypothetical protein ACRCX8_03520 [Sarcina sp.]
MVIMKEGDYIAFKGNSDELGEFSRILRNCELKGRLLDKVICKMAAICSEMVKGKIEYKKVRIVGVDDELETILSKVIPTNFLAIKFKDVSEKGLDSREPMIIFKESSIRSMSMYSLDFDLSCSKFLQSKVKVKTFEQSEPLVKEDIEK